jgi:hypothetical protein
MIKRRNSINDQWSARRRQMLESPAYRVLSQRSITGRDRLTWRKDGVRLASPVPRKIAISIMLPEAAERTPRARRLRLICRRPCRSQGSDSFSRISLGAPLFQPGYTAGSGIGLTVFCRR